MHYLALAFLILVVLAALTGIILCVLAYLGLSKYDRDRRQSNLNHLTEKES